MDYQETIAFLYNRLPVFHQIGARAFKPGLDTTIAMCESLGNPQTKFPCIHIGGTNGKGSTSHMIASVLQEAGYKVGLYTSPHLKSFTERIKVNGQEIDQAYVVRFVDENLSNIDRFEPSFFELTVSMCFAYFAHSEVDIAVIEVGMGGRMDSTNVIHPILSLITNVSYDHTQFLGDTLVKIATEKAGIIKEAVPVVISEYQDDEIASVFNARAASLKCEIRYGALEYQVSKYDFRSGELVLDVTESSTGRLAWESLRLDLSGKYQLKNVCGVLTALDMLNKIGYNVTESALRRGIGSVSLNTGLKGRWQRLSDAPVVYCDTAHNYAGLSETITQFESLPSSQMRFVLGFVQDKDVSAILHLFPTEAVFYFCQPSNLRALPASELAHTALEMGLVGKVFTDVNEALKSAFYDASDTDTIYVGGSTFVVADLDQL